MRRKSRFGRQYLEVAHGPAELPVLIILAAALPCVVWAVPAHADWDVVEVVTPPSASAGADAGKAVPPAIGKGWAPVSSEPLEKSASRQKNMQSTVGPQPVPEARDDDDELPPIRDTRRQATVPDRPARMIAPGSPGLAASKLVPKASVATPTGTPAPAPAPESATVTPEKTVPRVAASPAAAPAPAVPPSGPARQYCVNIADAAADARFAWKAKTLAEIEQELDKRIETLEQKTAEFQKWLAKRDAFSKKAVKQLVDIYRRMASDAAAEQLVMMDPETAAAVIAKLDARVSGAILNEMQPRQAARLTTIIAGSAKIPSDTAGTRTAERDTARPGQTPSDAGKL